jgi:type IV secretory pathway VirB10-like protein
VTQLVTIVGIHASQVKQIIAMNTSILRLPLLAILLALAFPAQAQLKAKVAQAATSVVTESTTDAATATPPPQPAPPPQAADPTEVPSQQAMPAEPPPQAAPAAPTLSDLGRSLRNYFTEEELELLFQYMKESVIASFKDEEVSLPPDLSFKLEILLVRLKKESDHYMDNLIKQIEADLKNSLKQKLKESLTPPPIKEQPYNPWLSKPWE